MGPSRDRQTEEHGTSPGFGFFPQPRRPGPLELAWNWRWEIGAASIVAFTSILIAISLGTVGLIAAAGAGLAATGTLMCWPPARKQIIARWWWLVTPHRVRTGCSRSWIQTFDGRLPVILSCAPAGYGERVRLWLPAGLTADRLRAACEELAAACWAAEVRVLRDPPRAHRVTLDVMRNPHPEPSFPHPRLPADDERWASPLADPSEEDAFEASR
jgi:hypothetical protein